MNITKDIGELFVNLKSVSDIRDPIINQYQKIFNNFKSAYVFGSAHGGNRVYNYLKKCGVEVLGFIDNDPKKHDKLLHGLKISSLDSLKDQKEANIIIASGYQCDIMKQLQNNGFTNIIPNYVFGLFDSEIFRPEVAFNDLHQEIIDNKEKYLAFYNSLADQKSKEVLNGVMNFRITYDLMHLAKINEPVSKEYFDPEIVKIDSQEVFIDCGGYDGDTVEKFIKTVSGQYQKIYYFEPCDNLFETAQKKLANFPNIEFHKQGIYSEEKILKFQVTDDLVANTISDEGNVEISVTSLDKIVPEKITLIKIDIEGAEEEAILGAKNHIKNDSPKMTFSAYHKNRDIWFLPELILSINPHYKFYLRHYSQNITNTILYAIPTRFN